MGMPLWFHRGLATLACESDVVSPRVYCRLFLLGCSSYSYRLDRSEAADFYTTFAAPFLLAWNETKLVCGLVELDLR